MVTGSGDCLFSVPRLASTARDDVPSSSKPLEAETAGRQPAGWNTAWRGLRILLQSTREDSARSSRFFGILEASGACISRCSCTKNRV